MGIAGRTAIVCAASKGLGRGCAAALAAEGVDLIVNARNEAVLLETARSISDATGVSVQAVTGDIATAEGRGAVLAACPAPDILVNKEVSRPNRSLSRGKTSRRAYLHNRVWLHLDERARRWLC